jgi:hypothetical protein
LRSALGLAFDSDICVSREGEKRKQITGKAVDYGTNDYKGACPVCRLQWERTKHVGIGSSRRATQFSYRRAVPPSEAHAVENFKMTGDVITEPERNHQHHLLRRQSQPLTRHDLVSAVQNSFANAVVDQIKKLNIDAKRLTDLREAKPQPSLLKANSASPIKATPENES